MLPLDHERAVERVLRMAAEETWRIVLTLKPKDDGTVDGQGRTTWSRDVVRRGIHAAFGEALHYYATAAAAHSLDDVVGFTGELLEGDA